MATPEWTARLVDRKRVAVVGGGIAGLGAAWTLGARHDVSLFERAGYLGGHTHTVTVAGEPGVDIGFIVYNEVTYPLLTRLFAELGVASRPTNMSFSVHCDRCGLVYSGLGLTGVFADARNATRPDFLRFLRGVQEFNRFGRNRARPVNGLSLGEFLDDSGGSSELGRHYVLPLASALWSTGIPDVRRLPLRTLLEFFRSHRLFRLTGRLRWRTIVGGSRRYVEAMVARLPAEVHTGRPVNRISRAGREVILEFADGGRDRFDYVVVATHADDALALLADPTGDESVALGAWRYADSDTWLHSDAAFLPPQTRARASWNYRLTDCMVPADGPTMTYNLNRLQGLEGDRPWLVTLNPGSDPRQAVLRRRFRHPIYTSESVASQEAIAELGERTRTFFCGAHLGYGFHEDALRSGVRVGERLGGRFM